MEWQQPRHKEYEAYHGNFYARVILKDALWDVKIYEWVLYDEESMIRRDLSRTGFHTLEIAKHNAENILQNQPIT